MFNMTWLRILDLPMRSTDSTVYAIIWDILYQDVIIWDILY